MYEPVKRIYNNGLINEDGLDRAIQFGWITSEQKAEIIASKQTITSA